MTGKRIRTLAQLKKAADDRKAVFPVFGRYTKLPAAFVLNQPGGYIHNLISSGLYIYKKPKK